MHQLPWNHNAWLFTRFTISFRCFQLHSSFWQKSLISKYFLSSILLIHFIWWMLHRRQSKIIETKVVPHRTNYCTKENLIKIITKMVRERNRWFESLPGFLHKINTFRENSWDGLKCPSIWSQQCTQLESSSRYKIQALSFRLHLFLPVHPPCRLRQPPFSAWHLFHFRLCCWNMLFQLLSFWCTVVVFFFSLKRSTSYSWTQPSIWNCSSPRQSSIDIFPPFSENNHRRVFASLTLVSFNWLECFFALRTFSEITEIKPFHFDTKPWQPLKE